MKTVIIILSLFCSFVTLAQTPIYHNIRKDKYITPVIVPTNDSIIDNLHKYVNICRSDVSKTSIKINLDLSEYPKKLPPLIRDPKLDKEAKRRCYEYVKFMINHRFYTHMYMSKNSGELLTGSIQDDNFDKLQKQLIDLKKYGKNVPDDIVKSFEKSISAKNDPYVTIENLLYEDGAKKVVTGHRDALLMSDNKNDYRIGIGYVKHQYIIIENGIEVKKYIEFLVVIIQHKNDIDNIVDVDKDDFNIILKTDKQCKDTYRSSLYEKNLAINRELINRK